jgi:hypothetical protein
MNIDVLRWFDILDFFTSCIILQFTHVYPSRAHGFTHVYPSRAHRFTHVYPSRAHGFTHVYLSRGHGFTPIFVYWSMLLIILVFRTILFCLSAFSVLCSTMSESSHLDCPLVFSNVNLSITIVFKQQDLESELKYMISCEHQ